MLALNYRYRIYPDATQLETLIEWMEICRSAYNYGLRELKDWCDSRKCLVDRCSQHKEYIIPADAKFPSEVNQINNLPKAKKEFPRLSMEDLDYRISAKGFLGKQMLDAGFGQFRTIVKYVCWKRGKFFAVVHSRGTSQECPECGAPVKKDLSVRVHQCSNCGYTTDRDVASSQVLKNRGIALMSTPGLGGRETACADGLPGVGATQSRQVSKTCKGITRKSKSRDLEAPTILRSS